MATYGPNSPSATSQTGTGVDWTWDGTNNAYAADDNPAYASDTGETKTLLVTGFGFSIPSGQSIVGVTVEIRRMAPFQENDITDTDVQLVIGGAATGDDKASGSYWPWNSYQYASYGGASDTWGLSITRSQVNASDFGVSLKATAATDTGYVDHIRVTVTTSATSAHDLELEEASGLVESFDRLAPAYRAPSEAIGLLDSVSRVSGYRFAYLIDCLAQSDSADRAVEFLRGFEDICGLLDSLIAGFNWFLTPTDYVGELDSVGTKTTMHLAFTDQWAVTDSLLGPFITALRTIIDYVGQSDSASRIHPALRTLSDVQGTGESISRLSAASRSVSGSFGASDSFSRQSPASRQITESLAAAEWIQRLASASRTITESLGLVDDPKAALQVALQVAEQAGLVDVAGLATLNRRSFIDQLSASETIVRHAGKGLRVASAMAFADEVVRQVTASRSVSDQLSVSGILYRAASCLRAFSDTSGLVDEASVRRALAIVASEFTGSTDSAARSHASSRSLTDSVGETDSVRRIVSFARAATATLGLAETISRALRQVGTHVWRPQSRFGDSTMSVTAPQILEKQPGETVIVAMDFTELLQEGETLASVVSVSVDPSGLTLGSASISGNRVLFTVSGGTTGYTHRFEVIVTTSNAQTLEADGKMLVTDA